MTTPLVGFQQIVMPSADDSQLARVSSQQLTRFLETKSADPHHVRIALDDEKKETISIPVSAFRLLVDIMTAMAKGSGVKLIPIQAELTTEQAADLIHVSPPFLAALLVNGTIPYHKVGQSRRVLFSDLMEYKETIDTKRLKTLEELSALDQELGLGG